MNPVYNPASSGVPYANPKGIGYPGNQRWALSHLHAIDRKCLEFSHYTIKFQHIVLLMFIAVILFIYLFLLDFLQRDFLWVMQRQLQRTLLASTLVLIQPFLQVREVQTRSALQCFSDKTQMLIMQWVITGLSFAQPSNISIGFKKLESGVLGAYFVFNFQYFSLTFRVINQQYSLKTVNLKWYSLPILLS